MIDPNIVTTVQVSELPPNELSPENEFPHQVGDILSKATIQQLVDYVRAQSVSQPYEIKYLYPPSTEYINDNFIMTPGSTQGLGRADGLWNGWAIFNGNNGTANLDGHTLIGYGANYATIGQFLGEEDVLLSLENIPAHRHYNGMSNNNQFPFVYGATTDGMPGLATTEIEDSPGTKTYQGITSSTGGGQAHNNMQPSMVVLMIYKLP